MERLEARESGPDPSRVIAYRCVFRAVPVTWHPFSSELRGGSSDGGGDVNRDWEGCGKGEMVDGSSAIEEEQEEVEDDSEGEQDRAKEDVASTPLMTVWGEWIYDILCRRYLCE